MFDLTQAAKIKELKHTLPHYWGSGKTLEEEKVSAEERGITICILHDHMDIHHQLMSAVDNEGIIVVHANEAADCAMQVDINSALLFEITARENIYENGYIPQVKKPYYQQLNQQHNRRKKR